MIGQMQLKRKIFFAVRSALATIAVIVPLHLLPRNAGAQSQANDFHIASQFSSVQGQNNWYYKYSNGTAYSDMNWVAANAEWEGSSRMCIVNKGWLHPDVNCEPVLAWKAPRAGTVQVQGFIDRYEKEGDGVKVKIVKNGTVVWPTGGWQTLSPRLSAQHIFHVQVAANDFIYFHVNALANNSFDTTDWAPNISYNLLSPYLLDGVEQVAKPSDFDARGIPFMDGSINTYSINGTQYWNHTYGAVASPKYSRLVGPLQAPLQSGTTYGSSFYTNSDTEGSWGWWIVNTYQISSTELLGFAHLEGCNVSNPAGQRCKYRIGVAYSNNGGVSYRRVGHLVVQANESYNDANNIEGLPYVVTLNDFVLYYNDVSSAGLVLSAAKVNKDQLIAWARGQSGPPACYKTTGSGWAGTSNCRGGPAYSIMPQSNWFQTGCTPKSHGDAAYSTFNGKYVMTANVEWCGKYGIWINFSNDGVTWERGSWIQDATYNRDPSKIARLSQYASIVNVSGADNGLVGNQFYVYWGYAPQWDVSNLQTLKNIYRQKVTLVNPTAAPTAVPTATAIPTPTQISRATDTPIPCAKKSLGDANCDGLVNLTDFERFRQEYTGLLTSTSADFTGEGKVTLIDFETWWRNFK